MHLYIGCVHLSQILADNYEISSIFNIFLATGSGQLLASSLSLISMEWII